MEEEHESLKSKYGSLELRYASIEESEEKCKEENWDLEVRLQELQDQISKTSTSLSKATSESSRLQNDKSSHIETIENLQMQEIELKQHLDSIKLKHENEMSSSRQEQENLREENNSLHQIISDLKEEMETNKGLHIRGRSLAEPQDTNDFDDEEEDMVTPKHSPSLLPVAGTPLVGSALETETIKSSLSHAHRTINNLRNTLSKEKTEKNELKRLLQETQDELERSGSGPTSHSRSKKTKPISQQRARNAFYGVRRTAVATSSNASLTDQSFHSALEDDLLSGTDAGFETATDGVTTEDDSYHTGRESIYDDISDGDLTETEMIPSGQDNSSSLSDDDSDNSLNASRGRRSLLPFSSQGLAPNSPNAYTESLSQQTTPVKPKSLADEFLSVPDIERHAEQHGLVVLSEEEYNDLVTKSEHQTEEIETEENWKSKAKSFGLTAILEKEHADLVRAVNSPTPAELKLKAQQLGLTTLPEEDHRELLRASSNPSKNEVESHVKSLGLVAIPASEHEKLSQFFNRPTHADLDEKCKSIGLVAVPKEDYESTLRTLNNPTQQELAQKAKSLQMVTLSEAEHADLLRSSNAPTVEELKSRATDMGYVALKEDDHNDLRRSAHSPTEDEITTRAKQAGLVALSAASFSALHKSANEPTLEELQQKAKQLGLTAVTESEFSALQQAAFEPSEQQLSERAKAAGFVTIKASEYDNLLQSAEHPSRDFLLSKAKDHGLVVVAKQEYEELTHPSMDQLVAKAGSVDAIVVPRHEFENLSKSANEPSTEELILKARKLNMVAIPAAEFSELKRSSTEPTREELSTLASSLGFAVLPVAAYKSLSNPTVEDLKVHASKHDVHVVSKDDFSEMTRPRNVEELSEQVMQHGYSTIKQDELTELRRAAHSPTIEEATSRAEGHGLSVLSDSAHAELKRKAHSPSQEELALLSQQANCHLVPNEEYDNLQKLAFAPDAEHISEIAKKYDLVTVPKDSYEELHANATNPSHEHILSNAEKLGLVVLTKSEFDETRHAASEQTSAGSQNDRSILPTREMLVDHAASMGMTLLPIKELEELKQSASEPIKFERQTESPTKEELDTFAAHLGYAVVPIDDLQALHKRADEPSQEDLERIGKRHGLAFMPIADLSLLERRSKEPTLSELQESAASQNASIVSNTELAELKRQLTAPTNLEVSTLAKSLGLVAVSTEEYEALEKSALEPDRSEIVAHCKRLGIAGITTVELEEITKKLNQPSKSEVEFFAKKLGFVIVPKDQYASLSDRVAQLDKLDAVASDSNTKSKQLGSVLARKEHFEGIIRKSALSESSSSHGEKVIESMRSLGYIPVSSEEYKRLVDNQQEYKPTKRDVLRSAKEFGLVAIASEEYKSLLKKIQGPDGRSNSTISLEPLGDEKIQSESPRSGTPLPYELSKTPEPIMFVSEEKTGLESVPTEYLASLRRIVETPTKEDVSMLAKKLGLVCVIPDSSANKAFAASLVSDPADWVAVPRIELEKCQVAPEEKVKTMARDVDNDIALLSASTPVSRSATPVFFNRPGTPGQLSRSVTPSFGIDTSSAAPDDVALNSKVASPVSQSQSETEDSLKMKASKLGLMVVPAALLAELEHFKHNSTPSLGRGLSGSGSEHIAVNVSSNDSVNNTALKLEEVENKLKQTELAHASTLSEMEALKHSSIKELEVHKSESAKELETRSSDFEKRLEEHKNESARDLESTSSEFEKKLEEHKTESARVLESQSSEFEKKLADTQITLNSLEEEYAVSLKNLESVQATLENSQKELDQTSKALQDAQVKIGENEKSLQEKSAYIIELEQSQQRNFEQLQIAEQDSANATKLVEESRTELARAKNELENLQTHSSTEDFLKNSAGSLGLAVISLGELSSLKQAQNRQLSHSELNTHAAAQGLVLVPEATYSELKRKESTVIPPVVIPSAVPNNGKRELSSGELADEAGKRDLLLISQKEHSLLREAAAPLTPDQLQTQANSLGLQILSNAEYSSLKAPQTRSLNEGTLRADAEQLGFQVLSLAEYNELLRQIKSEKTILQQPIHTDSRGISQGNIVNRTPVLSSNNPYASHNPSAGFDYGNGASDVSAPALGSPAFGNGHRWEANTEREYAQHLEDSQAARSIISESPKSRNNADENFERSSQDHLVERLAEPATFKTPRRKASNMSLQRLRREGVNNTRAHSPQQPSVMNMSMMTVNTNASLQDRHMIQVITQVVIGEYLFKYTRRRGLTGITDNRHERYFWVHPYTLTLYWSHDNPAIELRNNGKAKSVAIVGVTSEEDANPLPPGLFHKSIVISTSEKKTLKITCPTRQRHNIWYGALLHLLRRSEEASRVGGDNESIYEDYLDEGRANTDQLQYPGSPARSASRMSNFRQGIAPEMNRARQTRVRSNSSTMSRQLSTHLKSSRAGEGQNMYSPPSDTPSTPIQDYRNPSRSYGYQ